MTKKISLFILCFTLLFSIVFQPSNVVQASTNETLDEEIGTYAEAPPLGYISVPAPYTGAIVYKVLSDPIAKYAQDEYYYYMQPAQAREFARQLRQSNLVSIAVILGGLYVNPVGGVYLGGVAFLENLVRADYGDKISKQSDYGPVRFTLVKNSYGWGVGPVSSWDGKFINVSNEQNGLIVYKSHQFLKAK